MSSVAKSLDQDSGMQIGAGPEEDSATHLGTIVSSQCSPERFRFTPHGVAFWVVAAAFLRRRVLP
jgi:hypothetical protein